LQREGGYKMFRDVVASNNMEVFYLKESLRLGLLQPIDLAELDQLYSLLLARESASLPQYIDVLLL
jgi:hypothetical protein